MTGPQLDAETARLMARADELSLEALARRGAQDPTARLTAAEEQAVVHGQRPFADLRETGLLWLINRQVLHPRGWALALHFDEESGEASGWSLMGDGHEPWNFADGTENDLLTAVSDLLAPLHE